MRRPTRRFVALTLCVIGILCLLVPELTSRLSGHALSGIQEQAIINTAPEDLVANQRRLTDQTPASDFDYGAIQSAPAWQSNPSLDTDSMVGVLEIPSVGLSLPILYGTTNEHLKSAATTMLPGQEMGRGNYALAGHNAPDPTVLFAPIRRIAVGDEIVITDKQQVYVYRMTGREIVEPERIDVLDPTVEPTITLVSCYAADGSNRIIITGSLARVEDYTEQ